MSETNTEVQVLQINEKASLTELTEQALLKFGKAKEVLTQTQLKLATIVIKDDATLAIANDIIADAKKKETMLENKRVIIKGPALEFTRAVDAAAKQLRVIIEEPIKRAEAKKLEYLKEQEAKRKEELRKAEEERVAAEQARIAEENKVKLIVQDITEYGKRAIGELYEATTEEHLKTIFQKYVKQFPGVERWGEMLPEATKMIEFVKTVGKTKKNIINYSWQLANATTDDQKVEINKLLTGEKAKFSDAAAQYNVEIKQVQAIAEQKVEAIAEKAEEVKSEALDKVVAASKQTTGLRKTWKYECEDIQKVLQLQPEWVTLSINEAKVKEWLQLNKTTLNPNGETINGIKFFQSEGLSGK